MDLYVHKWETSDRSKTDPALQSVRQSESEAFQLGVAEPNDTAIWMHPVWAIVCNQGLNE